VSKKNKMPKASTEARDTRIPLKFQPVEIGIILRGLSELPVKVALPLIQSIQGQLTQMKKER